MTGAAATSAERGREVRQALLSAATGLIAERGWSAVSTRMLAERAGVGAGLVHYHFSSLRALLTEAALDAMRGLADGLTELLDRARTPEEALDAMLGALDAYDGQDPTSMLFTEAYLAAARDEGLRDGIDALMRGVREEFAAWLDRHGVAGPEETAAVLAAAVDGVMLHRTFTPGLASAAVGPVLRRLLVRDGAREEEEEAQ
ncbi:TetR/AcrR family transcriptional regulator [Streptomyces albiaxialis]|uniref:TetR/AcrR family transcriptional regulator n=1 Tax=Streptomyces albiaxialis TaxID=329523 RepID=A0ABN2VFS9_9ACTN